MGIKTKLTKKDIQPFIKISKLQKTKHGISDTVYILDDKYILKLFETNSLLNIHEEIKLLKHCKDLKVSKLLKKPFTIKNKPVLLYKKCYGKSVKKVKHTHIRQIGKFLKEFHQKTKNKTSANKNIFSRKNLKKLIIKTKNVEFLTIYNTIQLSLKNDGIIHGDIFKDNALFQKDKLNCIIDFSEACNGDFYFDLAVIAIDWCKSDKELKLLLKSYDSKLTLKKLKLYMKYALLYYTTTRYLDNKDYNQLLKRMKKL